MTMRSNMLHFETKGVPIIGIEPSTTTSSAPITPGLQHRPGSRVAFITSALWPVRSKGNRGQIFRANPAAHSINGNAAGSIVFDT
jgi:hypothetical protein